MARVSSVTVAEVRLTRTQVLKWFRKRELREGLMWFCLSIGNNNGLRVCRAHTF